MSCLGVNRSRSGSTDIQTCRNITAFAGQDICVSNPEGNYAIPSNSQGSPTIVTTTACVFVLSIIENASKPLTLVAVPSRTRPQTIHQTDVLSTILSLQGKTAASSLSNMVSLSKICESPLMLACSELETYMAPKHLSQPPCLGELHKCLQGLLLLRPACRVYLYIPGLLANYFYQRVRPDTVYAIATRI